MCIFYIQGYFESDFLKILHYILDALATYCREYFYVNQNCYSVCNVCIKFKKRYVLMLESNIILMFRY